MIKLKDKDIEKVNTKFKQIINKINNFLHREYKCWKIFVRKLNDINNENINNNNNNQDEQTDNINSSNILYVIHD